MMTEGLNPLELVLNASIVVQIVMALLLLASIVSWSIMLRKRAELRRARTDADRFEEVFWSGGDLTAMFRAIDQGRRVTKGMEAIFERASASSRACASRADSRRRSCSKARAAACASRS